MPGVQALTTGGTTSYVQRDPKGGLLSIAQGSTATAEYYYVLDGQSSVIGLVDAAGTERAEYTYDPYGAHDSATAVGVGGLPDNPYRYASGRAVATNSSGNILLYQYGERFYNPTTGRWTQQDNLEHLGDPAQGNRYTYVAGDPVNGIDPTGRSTAGQWGGGVAGSLFALGMCAGLGVPTLGLGCAASVAVMAGVGTFYGDWATGNDPTSAALNGVLAGTGSVAVALVANFLS